ncbi:DNA polymerase alpha zinc finger-domain-containing protein [Infundibulicybe gibba]|nr:DNA polymerase alpha zinc finger-domain-containing protein [Infundibulicybe gibba]
MKRRGYCALSKTILSGEATENVVVSIHEYLTTIGDNVRERKTKLEDFIVFERLGKNSEDYPDAKSQPHSKGGTTRAGDVIPYVFYFEHYLSKQVLPPIERPCEPIEGTDRARLAECLGSNPDRYRPNNSGGTDMSNAKRFRDAVPFIVECRECKGSMPFAPIHEHQSAPLLPTGSACLSCKAPLKHGSLQMQLEAQIRRCILRYYEGWTVCDDFTCRSRTRAMGVYGRQCLCMGCGRTVQFGYGDEQMYNQLRYFASFDPNSIVKAGRSSGAYRFTSYLR